MSSAIISGVGKLNNSNSASYNMMTIQAVAYGCNAVFSVITQATSIEELYNELMNDNIHEKWLISHGTSTANLTAPNHPKKLIFPRLIQTTTLNDKPGLKILTQEVAFDFTNGYFDVNTGEEYYIMPFGGGTIYDSVLNATILTLQQFV